MPSKRILIVGGVAGGAACAARLRRLDEAAEIFIYERGPDVSFANCGLPYYLGGVIAERQRLLVATPERFRDWLAIEVRTRHVVGVFDLTLAITGASEKKLKAAAASKSGSTSWPRRSSTRPPSSTSNRPSSATPRSTAAPRIRSTWPASWRHALLPGPAQGIVTLADGSSRTNPA